MYLYQNGADATSKNNLGQMPEVKFEKFENFFELSHFFFRWLDRKKSMPTDSKFIKMNFEFSSISKKNFT
jgi:hypothetical protein